MLAGQPRIIGTIMIISVFFTGDAGWTTWNNWHDCTRTCGGGYRVRNRNCSNPTWNYFGSDRDCQDSKDYQWERCNTQTCLCT